MVGAHSSEIHLENYKNLNNYKSCTEKSTCGGLATEICLALEGGRGGIMVFQYGSTLPRDRYLDDVNHLSFFPGICLPTSRAVLNIRIVVTSEYRDNRPDCSYGKIVRSRNVRGEKNDQHRTSRQELCFNLIVT